jgi:hypothetical protein
MFKCEECNKNIGPGIRVNIIVTETRNRIYKNYDKETGQFTGETQGTEIVTEKKICSNCKERIETVIKTEKAIN